MAAVLGILRGHHGTIQIESTPGKGSTFRVLLPPSSRPARVVAATDQREAVTSRGGRILLVDDEELLRRATRRYLVKAGFDVVLARDGEDGLAAFHASAEAFDAVIVDLSMPGMDGVQLIREPRSLRPEVSVILTSGCTASDLASRLSDGDQAPPDMFLQKPFAPSLLVQELRRLLQVGDNGNP